MVSDSESFNIIQVGVHGVKFSSCQLIISTIIADISGHCPLGREMGPPLLPSVATGFIDVNKAAGNIIANILGELLVKDKDEENQEPYPYQYPYQNPYLAPYGDSDPYQDPYQEPYQASYGVSDIDRQDDVDGEVGEGVSLVSIIIAAFVGAIIGQLAVAFYGDSLFQNCCITTTCV